MGSKIRKTFITRLLYYTGTRPVQFTYVPTHGKGNFKFRSNTGRDDAIVGQVFILISRCQITPGSDFTSVIMPNFDWSFSSLLE